MKLTTYLSETIGADRMLHFCVGMLIPLLFLPFGIFAVWSAALLVSIMAMIKERVFDDVPDMTDFFYSVGGAFVTIIYSMLIWMGQQSWLLNPHEMIELFEQYNV